MRCRVLVAFHALGALGWGHNMKFNMGLNMMDMVGVVRARLSDIKFPFIVLHDPKDGESSPRREGGRLLFYDWFVELACHARMRCAGESQVGVGSALVFVETTTKCGFGS